MVVEKLTLAESSCSSVTVSLLSCLVPSYNSRVLSAFILSRLLPIHSPIRSTQETKRYTVVDADAAGALMYNCVSSAGYEPTILNNSAVYSRNSNGPRTELCDLE